MGGGIEFFNKDRIREEAKKLSQDSSPLEIEGGYFISRRDNIQGYMVLDTIEDDPSGIIYILQREVAGT